MRRRSHRDQRGFTVLEMTIAVSILSIFMVGVYGLLYGFMRDVDRQSQLSATIRDVRPVIKELVIELRQAKPAGVGSEATPVGLLAWDKLTFYSDRQPADGAPERYAYSLQACVSGVCQLEVAITQPTAGSAPIYDYTATALTRVLLQGVSAGTATPLFKGIPSTGLPISACVAGTAAPCTFPLVKIDLRTLPGGSSATWKPYQLTEQVRLRNGTL